MTKLLTFAIRFLSILDFAKLEPPCVLQADFTKCSDIRRVIYAQFWLIAVDLKQKP